MSNMGNAHYFSGIHNKAMKQVSKKLIFKPASYVYRWGNSPVPPKIKAVNFKSGKIKGQIRRSKRYSILFDNIGNKAGWNQILDTIQDTHNPFVSEKDRPYITFSSGLNELKNESFSRSESLDTGIYDDFSTERDIIFSASPLASAFCFFNKLVASVVVLVAVALGNGCGGDGDGQYPYQEQQGGGAEYDFEPLTEYLPEVPLEEEEEEEVHRKNEEICKKFPRENDYDPEKDFVRKRASPVQNGKVKIQDECALGVPPPVRKPVIGKLGFGIVRQSWY